MLEDNLNLFFAVTTPQNRKGRHSGHQRVGLFFYRGMVDLSVGILGDASSGGHQAVMTDLLDTPNSEEFTQFAPSAEVCSFGPATGLART